MSFKLRKADSMEAKVLPEFGPVYKTWWLSDPGDFFALHGAKAYIQRLLKLCGKQPKGAARKDAVPGLPDGFCDPDVPA